MNLRHPKVIRLGGWGALVATLLAVSAGAFLAFSFFQSGNLLNAGLAGGITLATAALGGLLTYLAFVFASMTAGQTPAVSEAAAEEPPLSAPISDEPVEQVRVEVDAAPAPDLSEEALPVFQAASLSDDGPWTAAPTSVDESEAELLVVPPPLSSPEESDQLVAELTIPDESSDALDSRMDLPVTVDGVALDAAADDLLETSDDAASAVEEPDVATAVQPHLESSTLAVSSALVQTDEVETIGADSEPDLLIGSSAPTTAVPSPADAFPEIFKSSPKTSAPAAAAPAPQAPRTPAPAAASRTMDAAPREASEQPAAETLPPMSMEDLPAAAELPEMAAILTPTAPSAGALPTEIPDFFLKMPTGRAMPTAKAPLVPKPAPPVAPRQVAAAKQVSIAPAAVRIVDSSTIHQEAEEELMTMTTIPDDWPS